MPHVIEPALSARAACRACGKAIAKDALRFGERVPNPFGDGEATYWFHLRCAACKRPEAFMALQTLPGGLPTSEGEALRRLAQEGVAHHRLCRIAGAERARSGRAKCRHCKAAIDKGAWRIVLNIWEEARFNPMGFVHAGCAPAYFGVGEIMERVALVAPQLDPGEQAELRGALAAPPPGGQ